MIRFCFCLIVLICVLSCQGQEDGQSCTEDGVTGICKPIMECPDALVNIATNNKIPKICGYVGGNAIVCCLLPTTQKESTTEYTPESRDDEQLGGSIADCSPVPANSTAPKTGQKAWDKCIEYQEQYIFPCEKSKAVAGSYSRDTYCKHNTNELILGGKNASEGEFPHMALLGFSLEKDSFKCGGTIVSDRYILTAGHCTSTAAGPIAYALVGTLKRPDIYDPKNLYNINRIIKHPDYAPPSKYHDIALVQVDRPMELSPSVHPACLDTGDESAEQAVATGWGALAHMGNISDVLQKVTLNKFTEEECTMAFPAIRKMNRGFDPNTQICYGDKETSKDACQGDSGGPLQIKSEPLYCMYVVVGVTSFGVKCGIGEPGIYTRVVNYLPWIESIVWP